MNARKYAPLTATWATIRTATAVGQHGRSARSTISSTTASAPIMPRTPSSSMASRRQTRARELPRMADPTQQFARLARGIGAPATRPGPSRRSAVPRRRRARARRPGTGASTCSRNGGRQRGVDQHAAQRREFRSQGAPQRRSRPPAGRRRLGRRVVRPPVVARSATPRCRERRGSMPHRRRRPPSLLVRSAKRLANPAPTPGAIVSDQPDLPPIYQRDRRGHLEGQEPGDDADRPDATAGARPR